LWNYVDIDLDGDGEREREIPTAQDKIRQMIEAGVRAGMADYDYRTALHLASSNGHLETCVFLLREGRVDPNPLDHSSTHHLMMPFVMDTKI